MYHFFLYFKIQPYGLESSWNLLLSNHSRASHEAVPWLNILKLLVWFEKGIIFKVSRL